MISLPIRFLLPHKELKEVLLFPMTLFLCNFGGKNVWKFYNLRMFSETLMMRNISLIKSTDS